MRNYFKSIFFCEKISKTQTINVFYLNSSLNPVVGLLGGGYKNRNRYGHWYEYGNRHGRLIHAHGQRHMQRHRYGHHRVRQPDLVQIDLCAGVLHNRHALGRLGFAKWLARDYLISKLFYRGCDLLRLSGRRHCSTHTWRL